MSQTNSEQSIVNAKANVMIYDDVNKKWNPSGATPGLSKVQIYQHLLNQTYRVVGRKIQDHEVVINCSLQKNLKYNQANQTFLQWRDSKQVYGLHFQCKDEADMFTQTLKMAVENLNRLAISSSSSASSTSSSNGHCNAGGGACPGGDNISLGKRSVASAGSSSDYSQSIYDDNENLNINRPNFNAMNGSSNVNGVINGMIGHHQTSLNSMYNGNVQTRMQSLNSAAPLSASSGPSNGSLTISVNNPINQNGYTNGYNYIQHQQQQQHHQQQILQQQQQSAPLYQSSPIPPPPPPPLPLNINLLPANNQPNDNFNSPKIYDTIPDTGTSYANHCAPAAAAGPPPPPPPPLPTSIFSASSAPPPPAPPPPSVPACHQAAPSQPSYISEIAKFQANKLKKVESEPNTAAKSNGPPGPLDFLAEIRQRIEKKNSMEKEHKNAPDTNVDTTSCKPSSLVNRNLNGKNQFAGLVNGLKSQQFESPKTIKKITSTPNVTTNGNGTNGVHSSDSINYDKLKQELIVEFRKELQTFKQDIVNTILNELRR